MRKRALTTSLMLLVGMLIVPKLLSPTPARAGETSALVSGFAVGESLPAFDVVDVTGPHKGQTLCYR